MNRLLNFLSHEVAGYEDHIEIIVSDNGSTDDTSAVIAQYTDNNIPLSVMRHPVNGGMDFNFLACFQRVRGNYFWILSDDDLPLTGFIPSLLRLLALESPDLVYLRSKWLPFGEEDRHLDDHSSLNYRVVSPSLFARSVHVWTTFLSGMIVRLNRENITTECLSSLEGTKLLQLSWVLDRLKYGKTFLIAESACVVATSGNTGGYSVLKVFGCHFPEIVNRLLSDGTKMSKIADSIIYRSRLFYMPGLIMGFRKQLIGDFEYSDIGSILLNDQNSVSLGILLLMPIVKLPLYAASIWFRMLSLASIPLLWFDKLRLSLRPVRTLS